MSPIPESDTYLNVRGRLACRTCGSELDPTMEFAMEKTRIDHVEVFVGKDGLGYHRTVYRNGEKGAVSEGLGSKDLDPAANRLSAYEAATADYEPLGLAVVNVEETG